MATKKEHQPEYQGLRGIWTKFNEPNKDTGNSYMSLTKEIGKTAKILIPFYTVGGAIAMGATFSAFELNNHDRFDRTIGDSAFSSEHKHIGLETEYGNIVVVQDENSWRVYTVDETRDDKPLLTYVDNQELAQGYIARAEATLRQEYEMLQNGGYHEFSNLYELGAVSGVYQDEGVSVRTAQFQWEIGDREGQSFGDRYEPAIDFLEAASEQLSDQTDGIEYGFVNDSTSVKYIDENPVFDWDDVTELSLFSGGFMGLIALSAFGLFVPGALGVEAGRRGVANHRRRKAKKASPSSQ